jgi:hypothetical protein
MLLALLKRLLRLWLFAGADRPTTVTVVRETIAPPPAPAVAGFVLRLAPPADLHLAARLASVAHLNTKAGRIPAARGKPAANSKAMPKLQPATRKRSPVQTSAIRGPATMPPVRNAQVVPMQKTSGSRCIPLDIRIQQAA